MVALRLENQFRSGANWFFSIAALSLVNSIGALAGSKWGFIIGLGLTQAIDGMASSVQGEGAGGARIVAFGLDVLVAGVIILFGVFARRRSRAAFVSGMVVYGLDGLIFLLVRDFLGIAFHVFALYCIYVGYKACKAILALQQAEEAAKTGITAAAITPN